jgi:hypothetical protein
MASILTPLYENLISNRIEINKLAQLRDNLLPCLMFGVLSITDVAV